MNIYNILDDLNIPYEKCTHKAVYTMEEAMEEKIYEKIEGVESKAMFVKNKKRYYLILSPTIGYLNLKEIAEKIGEPKLSLASEERLKEILNTYPGSVSPLALIYDNNNIVKVIMDSRLKGKKMLMHPCINTESVSILYEDLQKFILWSKHQYIEI